MSSQALRLEPGRAVGPAQSGKSSLVEGLPPPIAGAGKIDLRRVFHFQIFVPASLPDGFLNAASAALLYTRGVVYLSCVDQPVSRAWEPIRLCLRAPSAASPDARTKDAHSHTSPAYSCIRSGNLVSLGLAAGSGVQPVSGSQSTAWRPTSLP